MEKQQKQKLLFLLFCVFQTFFFFFRYNFGEETFFNHPAFTLLLPFFDNNANSQHKRNRENGEDEIKTS